MTAPHRQIEADDFRLVVPFDLATVSVLGLASLSTVKDGLVKPFTLIPPGLAKRGDGKA